MEMTVAIVNVSGVVATANRIKLITRGIVGANVQIVYDSTVWIGLRKTVVFEGSGVTRDVLDAGEIVEIPPEVASEANSRIRMGIYGVSDDGSVVVPTIWAELGRVRDSADPSGDESTAPELPVWAQLDSRVKKLESQAPSDGDSSAFYIAISEENGSYVMDKTFPELKEAHEAGRPVYAIVNVTVENSRVNNAIFQFSNVFDAFFVFTYFGNGMLFTAYVNQNGISFRVKRYAEESSIPDKLPNPNALTFTGAVSGSYDGSAPVTLNIPDSGGNVDYVGVEPAYEDIPKIFFGGALQQTKDEKVVPFRYISKTDDFSGYAEIKAQGNSSMSYPKKNQTVKMFKDADCTEKMKVDFKGWGKQNKHVYKANWIDLTHARNVVSARLWADVVKSRANYAELPELLRTAPNQGAVDGFPVKVYANGVYQGRYTLNIPKDKWTFNMDDKLEEHCVLCGEGYESGCFRAVSTGQWTDEIHDSMPVAISNRWKEIITFVMNSTDDEFRANLSQYFYVDSLIDYYLFGLASCGLDAFGKNQIYATYDGQKWIASMYDMDSTWGLYWNGSRILATDYARTSYEDFANGRQGNLLYIRLEHLFWSELQTRWAELKNGALSTTNIINRFERFTDNVPAELVKEDYASTTGGGAFTGIPSKDTNNIQQIRSYAFARQAWTSEYVAGLTPEVEVPCTGISLSSNILTFTAEGTQTLTATVTPDGCTESVTWESNNTSVATVSGGVVTAIANGSATITAKCGEYSASCSVAVSGIAEPKPCTGITLDKTELAFDGEGTQTITATVNPSDTTDFMTWISSAPAVASIIVEGNVCTVQSVSNGSAEIIVTCGSQSATCAVTVSGIVDESLLYSLAEATTFNGISDYIDTGVKLCDENKDFTVILDFQPTESNTNQASVFDSMYEEQPWPGVKINYEGRYLLRTSSSGFVEIGTTDSKTNRTKIAFTYSASKTKFEAMSFVDNVPLIATDLRQIVATFEQTALLGCGQKTDGTKQRFWAGTIYGCEIYNRALDVSEIATKIGVDCNTIAEWNSSVKVDSAGLVVSGTNVVSGFVEIPEGVTSVLFRNDTEGEYTWCGMWEYDENHNFIGGAESGGKPYYIRTLQANTKYIRVSAYPATAACNDPANQLMLIW